ncbi:MAG: hypothetical protein JO272_01065 [Pseudonocardiales bacterium]|nr:hypothetical protein [Pseudonocardiales bacterium]
MDPGLQFWLRYVDDHGGLTEPATDGTLVVLPPAVAAEFDLPDELMVTSDPDVAREDGTVLLTTGHPVLVRAADTTLTGGDAGVVALAAPNAPAPGADYLQDRVREQFPVDHGRIDVTGLPTRVTRLVLRVGALVTYTVSDEECYQERLECWVDALSGLSLGDDDVARLQRAPRAINTATLPASLLAAAGTAVEHAHRVLDAAANRRRRTLSAQAADAHGQERTRARAYYDDVLRSLECRRATAHPDRAELLAARAATIREERARRLLEIDEKYQARHDIRPFRLHALLVPGWRVPVDIRRGARRYPSTFDWLPALASYANEGCPHCGATAPLSASKTRLGCIACQPGPVPHAVPAGPVQPATRAPWA